MIAADELGKGELPAEQDGMITRARSPGWSSANSKAIEP